MYPQKYWKKLSKPHRQTFISPKKLNIYLILNSLLLISILTPARTFATTQSDPQNISSDTKQILQDIEIDQTQKNELPSIETPRINSSEINDLTNLQINDIKKTKIPDKTTLMPLQENGEQKQILKKDNTIINSNFEKQNQNILNTIQKANEQNTKVINTYRNTLNNKIKSHSDLKETAVKPPILQNQTDKTQITPQNQQQNPKQENKNYATSQKPIQKNFHTFVISLDKNYKALQNIRSKTHNQTSKKNQTKPKQSPFPSIPSQPISPGIYLIQNSETNLQNTNHLPNTIIPKALLPFHNHNWILICLLANIITFFLLSYLRLHSGNSPGYISYLQQLPHNFK